MAQGLRIRSCLCDGVDLIPGLVQWVRDLALPSRLQL